ncbi:MAG: STAS domain-containing protein [Verrucomicrobiales bacterium]|nr:STAS domain-containing protein [Verrucomicrobiales bacterium]
MKFETIGDSLRAGCPAELTAPNAAAFRDETRAAVAPHHQHVEIDMSQTRFLDSSGLGALISIHKLMCGRGGSVRILKPTPTVLQILELTRMHRIIEIRPA